MLTHSEANKEAVFNIGFASRTARFIADCCLVKYLSRLHCQLPPPTVVTNALLLLSLGFFGKKKMYFKQYQVMVFPKDSHTLRTLKELAYSFCSVKSWRNDKHVVKVPLCGVFCCSYTVLLSPL